MSQVKIFAFRSTGQADRLASHQGYDIFGWDENIHVVSLLPVGYPAEKPDSREKGDPWRISCTKSTNRKLPREEHGKKETMRVMRAMAFVLISVFVAGCSSSQVRENMYHGIYDGLRTESVRGTTPADNAIKPDMSYDQYRQQRKELLKRE
jgi:hypothetical protein